MNNSYGDDQIERLIGELDSYYAGLAVLKDKTNKKSRIKEWSYENYTIKVIYQEMLKGYKTGSIIIVDTSLVE